jgi:hypothetical protein
VQLLNRLVDLDEILYGGDGVEVDPDALFLIQFLQLFKNVGHLNF